MTTTLHDLQLPELLECDPARGVIRLHSERVVLLSAAAIGLLHFTLKRRPSGMNGGS